ncbi:hypothetical protein [Paraburkholderia ginsengiterrae]|uniref:hypothetical protein n=1 Tax=Paraburkholderia ginsengiterrae TaxID=1462993 RepID=UPI001041F6FD|nr:hypothetical protein [Paraburkholderia ginsengiterrae]
MSLNKLKITTCAALLSIFLAAPVEHVNAQQQSSDAAAQSKKQARLARKQQRAAAKAANRAQLRQLDKGAFKRETDRTESPYEGTNRPPQGASAP